MKRLALALALVSSSLFAACGGGGGTAPTATVAAATAAPTTAATAAPTVAATAAPTIAATAVPQQVTMSLPGGSAIGQEIDPTYGAIGGYTQASYSQTLAFVPGAKIMIVNGQPGVPHTLNVLSQTSFPANPTLPITAAGGSTIASGFSSGSVTGGTSIGPFTLAAGLYYIGCGFHYVSNTMRTVINVAAAATPGPQATPVPSTPIGNGLYGY